MSKRQSGNQCAAMPGPDVTGNLDRDRQAFSSYWQHCLGDLDALPAKPARTQGQQQAVMRILTQTRAARTRFLRSHVTALYLELTDGMNLKLRVEQLAEAAGKAVPGLVPDAARLGAEGALAQKDKDGHEVDQGILFNAILADRSCGLDLCHAMLLPKQTSLDGLDGFAHDGRSDLGTVVVERKGGVSTVWMKNPRFLNAEDETTLQAMETAVDLALLDPATNIVVLRGHPIDGGKYDGKRVFSTGINLTHLYHGKISYLWYLIRDLGFVSKMFRGLAYRHVSPMEPDGETLEKLWIGVVERFAIGGGCQYLLVMDYVLAGDDAYITLPARREGIIPGAANLRLPRFVGDRIARQAIQYERRIDCDSPEGAMICDQIVPGEGLDAALAEVARNLTSSGVVSAASNRRGLRVSAEPLDTFRQYMAVYAREQAQCHFSPALISNLEMFWNAQNRTA